jgi:23S rRNA (uracil1939-C5)-methyltransferase
VASKNKIKTYEQLEVLDIGAEGKAIAKAGDLVIFIPGGIPGDIVDVQVKRKRRKYLEGKPLHYHKYSDKRIEPICEHFDNCGGCKWQHLPYSEQLKYKQKQVTEQFKHIGKLEIPEELPIIPSKETTYYRNKLEFTFSNKRWLTEEEIKSGQSFGNTNALGFHISGIYDKILDIKRCYLQGGPSNQIRNAVKEFALQNKLSFFDIKNQHGLLRNLTIRTSSIGENMVIVSFFENDDGSIKKVMEFINKSFPGLDSLMYVINPKGNDSIYDLTVNCYQGNPYIYEELDGYKFKLGPKSFYQTNSKQAAVLYNVVKDFMEAKGQETVYDLYTGIGTIANYISAEVKSVIGIESVAEAIEYANINAHLNGINNVSFYTGDMKDILNNDFIDTHNKPDIIILDPPRAGVHPNVINAILYADPDKVVYVSCNPATQARDIKMMENKYKVVKTQPVDMFPHTHHVENVTLLKRK